jgi:hypothetical protein
LTAFANTSPNDTTPAVEAANGAVVIVVAVGATERAVESHDEESNDDVDELELYTEDNDDDEDVLADGSDDKEEGVEKRLRKGKISG